MDELSNDDMLLFNKNIDPVQNTNSLNSTNSTLVSEIQIFPIFSSEMSQACQVSHRYLFASGDAESTLVHSTPVADRSSINNDGKLRSRGKRARIRRQAACHNPAASDFNPNLILLILDQIGSPVIETHLHHRTTTIR